MQTPFLVKNLMCNGYTTIQPFVRDYQGWPVPEETFTHSHPSWSSDILYQLPPSTTIHSIPLVQFTCLTVLFLNLSPGPLWSSCWSRILYSMHFFTQSSSPFRNTCPYHRSCNTNVMSPVPNLTLSSLLGNLSFTLMPAWLFSTTVETCWPN